MPNMPRREESADRLPETLRDMGVSEGTIMDALMAGRARHATYTGFNTVGSAGTAAQSWVARSISEDIARGRMPGWRRTDPEGQATFTNEESRMRFITFSGDEGTGRPGATPGARCLKGRRTRLLIDMNRALLGIVDDGSLFPGTLDPETLPDPERMTTWVLLFRMMPDGGIRSEFSLPIGYQTHGTGIDIVVWQRRIILGEIGPEGTMPDIVPGTPDPGQYDFAIRRKES